MNKSLTLVEKTMHKEDNPALGRSATSKPEKKSAHKVADDAKESFEK